MPGFEYREPVKISVLSTTYVKCRVSATENGAAINPTSGTVEFAFIPESSGADPVSGDWKAGSWESAPDGYWARCLVGPSGTVLLAVNSYDVWIRVTKNPETVVDQVGGLKIF